MQRFDQFWDGWKQLALQLAETWQICQAVVGFHICARKPLVRPISLRLVLVACPERVPEGWRDDFPIWCSCLQTVFPKLTHKYHRSNLEAVHAWWLRWGDSFLQRFESVE